MLALDLELMTCQFRPTSARLSKFCIRRACNSLALQNPTTHAVSIDRSPPPPHNFVGWQLCLGQLYDLLDYLPRDGSDARFH